MNSTVPRLNPRNKPVTKGDISAILSGHGLPDVPVNDIDIYQRAFIHKSYQHPNPERATREGSHESHQSVMPLQPECNENLELLGDAILGSVVISYLYDRYPDQNEGFKTNLKMNIVRGKTLGMLSEKLGLNNYIVISGQVEEMGGRNNPRILEDLFEAFLGAIYLDNGGDMLPEGWSTRLHSYEEKYRQLKEAVAQGETPSPSFLRDYIEATDSAINRSYFGYQICQSFIVNIIETMLNLSRLIDHNSNYKARLLYFFQQNWRMTPSWDLLGRDEQKRYIVGVNNVDGELIGTGTSHKKQEAEQQASKRALRHLLRSSTGDGEDLDISDSETEM